MTFWDDLANTKVENAERYLEVFARVVHQAKMYQYLFHEEIKIYEDFSIVCDKKSDSYFIFIVPDECRGLFRKMQIEHPDTFQGFSVLCGKKDDLPLRVCCFGVSISLLGSVLEQ
jgi:hypothetical protein